MKKLLLLTLLCVSAHTFAQDGTTKIPSEAVAVATVKGGNLLQLMSIAEINNSYAGKKLLKEFSKDKESAYTSLEDFGIDLDASSHYFYQINDSINYNALILPIKEVSKLETLLTSKNNREIITQNGIRSFKEDDKIQMAWNESTMVVVFGTVSDYYFEDAEVMARYGLQDLYSYDDTVTEAAEPYEEYEETENAEDAMETVEEATVEMVEEDMQPEVEIVEEVAEQEIEDAEESVVEAPYSDEPTEIIIEGYEDGGYYSDYNSNHTINANIKKELAKEWSQRHAIDLLAQPASQSIVNNKSYLASLDKEAEATLWVSDFGKIYENLLGSSYYNSLTGFNIGSMYANSGMTAKLYAEDDKIQVNTTYSVSNERAESYKKMSNRKLNKKFLNYINEDRMIGYMSYAMNTEEMLKEYPKMMKNIYAGMPSYGDEASLAIDLVELLLDEEAVSKVFRGDMLFLLSGISQKEVTYTSYEYNDDYEYEEVEKTKTETVPDFLWMVTSEDQKFLNKLIDYGMKKEVVTSQSGYYALYIPKSPISVFFTFKDDILFMGTSETEMRKIISGTFDTKVSSKHKNLLKNSNYSAYLSGKQLASKIPMEDMSLDAIRKLNWFLKNSEDGYIKSSKIKGNNIKTEMVIEVPKTEENSLKYLFSIIETFSK